MDQSLIITTIYTSLAEIMIINYAYKVKHVHHWLFGVILYLTFMPVILINMITPKAYYNTLIIGAVTLSITSFLMDYKDFKEWFQKTKRLKNNKR